MPTRRIIMGSAMGSVLGAALAGGMARPSMAAPVVVSENGLALGGYDSVAYWTAQKAAKGQPSLSFKWSGVSWIFANPENRAAFAATPERYAPAFNGYCVYCLAGSKLVPGVADFWHIDKARLYLQSNAHARDTFITRVDHYVERATAYWAQLG